MVHGDDVLAAAQAAVDGRDGSDTGVGSVGVVGDGEDSLGEGVDGHNLGSRCGSGCSGMMTETLGHLLGETQNLSSDGADVGDGDGDVENHRC